VGCRRIAGFAPAPGDGRCVWSRREQFRHAEKVVGSAYEVGCELGPFDSAESRFAKAADGLHPAEDLLDPLSYLQTDGVAGMSRGSRVERRAASGGVLRDVWRDVAIATGLHEVSRIVALVAERGAAHESGALAPMAPRKD